jgi:hypothetical protein
LNDKLDGYIIYGVIVLDIFGESSNSNMYIYQAWYSTAIEIIAVPNFEVSTTTTKSQALLPGPDSVLTLPQQSGPHQQWPHHLSAFFFFFYSKSNSKCKTIEFAHLRYDVMLIDSLSQ